MQCTPRRCTNSWAEENRPCYPNTIHSCMRKQLRFHLSSLQEQSKQHKAVEKAPGRFSLPMCKGGKHLNCIYWYVMRKNIQNVSVQSARDNNKKAKPSRLQVDSPPSPLFLDPNRPCSRIYVMTPFGIRYLTECPRLKARLISVELTLFWMYCGITEI